jgi:hypothetical protein
MSKIKIKFIRHTNKPKNMTITKRKIRTRNKPKSNRGDGRSKQGYYKNDLNILHVFKKENKNMNVVRGRRMYKRPK